MRTGYKGGHLSTGTSWRRRHTAGPTGKGHTPLIITISQHTLSGQRSDNTPSHMLQSHTLSWQGILVKVAQHTLTMSEYQVMNTHTQLSVPNYPSQVREENSGRVQVTFSFSNYFLTTPHTGRRLWKSLAQSFSQKRTTLVLPSLSRYYKTMFVQLFGNFSQ